MKYLTVFYLYIQMLFIEYKYNLLFDLINLSYTFIHFKNINQIQNYEYLNYKYDSNEKINIILYFSKLCYSIQLIGGCGLPISSGTLTLLRRM